MKKSKDKEKGKCCNVIFVPKNCCHIYFEKYKKRYKYSLDDFETIRNEHMIIDVAKNGLILGIELLSSKKAKKPCQDL